MSNSPYKKIHVVINPASGKNEPIINVLNDVFHQYDDIDWSVSVTKKFGDATEQAREAAEQWLKGTEYEVISTTSKPDGVLIRITGSGDTPPKSDLVDAIQETGQREIHVILEVIPAQIEEFTVQ
jgi:hypothetical protein